VPTPQNLHPDNLDQVPTPPHPPSQEPQRSNSQAVGTGGSAFGAQGSVATDIEPKVRSLPHHGIDRGLGLVAKTAKAPDDHDERLALHHWVNLVNLIREPGIKKHLGRIHVDEANRTGDDNDRRVVGRQLLLNDLGMVASHEGSGCVVANLYTQTRNAVLALETLRVGLCEECDFGRCRVDAVLEE
jgi:hypothetical protein